MMVEYGDIIVGVVRLGRCTAPPDSGSSSRMVWRPRNATWLMFVWGHHTYLGAFEATGGPHGWPETVV